MDNQLALRFTAELRSHQGIIQKICRMYTRNREDSNDLFQEILLNAWKSYPQFRQEAKFSTWLFRVALNTALVYKRTNRWTGVLSFLSLEQMAFEPAEPEAVGEEFQLLDKAIEQLNPAEKSIILLYMENVSYLEMADILGISINLVGVKLHRVKDKLRQLIIDQNGVG